MNKMGRFLYALLWIWFIGIPYAFVIWFVGYMLYLLFSTVQS